MPENLLPPPEPLRAITYDTDANLFGQPDVADVDMLWGRLVHHALLMDEVVLTDSAMVTNPGLLELVRRGRLQPLLESGALRVAVRDSKELPALYEHFRGGRDDVPQAAYAGEVQVVASLLQQGHARLPFVGARVAALYSQAVDEFVSNHEDGAWADGDADLAFQMERILRYAREMSARDTEQQRADGPPIWTRARFFVWNVQHNPPSDLLGAEARIDFVPDPRVQARLEAGLTAPYSLTVAQQLGEAGLDIGPWLAPRGTREMQRARLLSSPREAIDDLYRQVRAGRPMHPDAARIGLRSLEMAIGLLLAPTNAEYRLLGQQVQDAGALLTIRDNVAWRRRRGPSDGPRLFDLDALLALVEDLHRLFPAVKPDPELGLSELRDEEDAWFARHRGGARVVERLYRQDIPIHSHQIELPGEARARMTKHELNLDDAELQGIEVAPRLPALPLAAPQGGLRIYAEQPISSG